MRTNGSGETPLDVLSKHSDIAPVRVLRAAGPGVGGGHYIANGVASAPASGVVARLRGAPLAPDFQRVPSGHVPVEDHRPLAALVIDARRVGEAIAALETSPGGIQQGVSAP